MSPYSFSSKLLYESVHELVKGRDTVIGEVRIPLESWTLKVGAETLAHARLTLLPWYGSHEYALFVGCNMIYGISCAIVHLHIRK